MITPKQNLFVAHYIANGMNGKDAAISAGYSPRTAESQASQLLKNPKVAAEVDKKQAKLLSKLEITAEKVLNELALIGFSRMTDYMQVSPDGRSFDLDFSTLTPEKAAAIQEITVDAAGGSGDGERRLVLRNRFKLGDKKGSLELLGKHLKLFTDKVEQSGPGGGAIQQEITVTLVRPK